MSRVKQGINDLYTWCIQNGEFGTNMIKEFTGVDIDGYKIDIKNIAKGSNKKLKWKCKNGHEWYAQPNSRTHDRSGCPICTNRGNRYTKDKIKDGPKDLLSWCDANGEYGKQIKEEFVGSDNGQLKISDISYGSKKDILWKCKYGHIFSMSPNSRTNIYSKYGCPICSGRRIEIGVNDFKTWCTNNSDYGKQLLREWTGITEDGDSIDINNINVCNKTIRLKWKCDHGHEWVTPLSSRTCKYRTGCPYCYNKIRSEIITASKLIKGENDLLTWCKNNISNIEKEFTGIDEGGNIIEIDNINIESHRRIKWKCNNGHEWYAPVRNRVKYGHGCPYCNVHSTSYPEQFLYRAFKMIYKDTINRGKFQGYEFDITIPELRLCIEYSDMAYHINKLDRDEYKKQLCKKT